VNKNLILSILILFFYGCSLDSKTSLWNKKKIETENSQNEEVLFKEKQSFNKEFNQNIKIKLNENFYANSFIKNNTNNNKLLNYSGRIKKISQFKFSKIYDFKNKNSDFLITPNYHFVYFDGNGTIFKLDENLTLVWKKNIYSKKEKKLSLSLNFSYDQKKIIVTDNLAYIYALDVMNGNVIWKQKNSSAFNSEIKIKNDKIYTVDFDNVLNCYSIVDGKRLWEYKSENTFIKSIKKLSLVLSDDKAIFINSVGDINALELQNGNLIWQTPTQGIFTNENSFSIIYSDIVLDDKTLLISNNNKELFALELGTGSILWKQNISSISRSSIIDKMIFTINDNGYLIVIDKENGNILRSTNIKTNQKKYRNSKPTGFVIAKNKIYLSLNNGYLIKVNIMSGKPENAFKIANKFISRSYIVNKKLYILSNNKIQKFE
tara:strand:- start:44 stop:1342 length:1299 start_codon:yes stop_codon:yes gene_type:complete